MVPCAARFVNMKANPQLIRFYLMSIEQASQQPVLRAGDRMERTSAVEHVGECFGLQRFHAASAIANFDTRGSCRSTHDPARNNLKPSLGDHSADHGGYFRRDTMSMNIPPRARVTQELPLLVTGKTLPD